jgi:hypothetical protein
VLVVRGRPVRGHAVVSAEKRQVFDLPEIRLHVVEHQIQRHRCTCGTVTAANAPEAARLPVKSSETCVVL